MPEPFPATGRICCDAAEGRLNAKSVVLQGCQVPMTNKVSVFDLYNVKEFTLLHYPKANVLGLLIK
jgi:hypothetical protein